MFVGFQILMRPAWLNEQGSLSSVEKSAWGMVLNCFSNFDNRLLNRAHFWFKVQSITRYFYNFTFRCHCSIVHWREKQSLQNVIWLSTFPRNSNWYIYESRQERIGCLCLQQVMEMEKSWSKITIYIYYIYSTNDFAPKTVSITKKKQTILVQEHEWFT